MIEWSTEGQAALETLPPSACQSLRSFLLLKHVFST